MERHVVIYLFHALLIAPALFYLAYARLNDITIPASVWRLLMISSVVVGLYHGYSAYRFMSVSKELYMRYL